MSVETRTRQSASSADQNGADPYRYGWRYVRRTLPDGRTVFDQVPLTLEDVLHPQEEDVIVHSDQHENIRVYLREALKARLAADPRVRVFSDLRFAWDVPGLKPLDPDVAIVFGVRKRCNWSTFDVAKEVVRPALVIEVTSPETRKLDIENKVLEYARAGVSLYVIVDVSAERKTERLELRGYQRPPAGYV